MFGRLSVIEQLYEEWSSSVIARSSTLTQPAAPQREMAPTYRLLGMLGMIGSPFLLLSFAAVGFEQEKITRLGSFLGLIFAIGWLSNVFGLWTLRATGTWLGGRILLGIEVVGVVLANLCQVYEIVDPKADSVLFHVTDIAWPLSMVTLLAIGIVAIVARRLQGWACFTPLVCGLWLPVSILAGAIFGTTAGLIIGGAHVTIGWLLLGYAIRNGGTSPQA
jgi:hypothetical protein